MMAEHLRQPKPKRVSAEGSGGGFDAMGKPIPARRRQAAYEHVKAMGIINGEDAWRCVGTVAEALERDKPYVAQAAAMVYLDLTGAYRLMAVLLTARKEAA